MSPKILICVYTCSLHEPFHEEFYQSEIGRCLTSFANSTLIHVFANAELPKPLFKKNRLTLNTQEAYTNLCVKTHRMIAYCARFFQFDYLIKIDISSGVKHLNLDERIVNRVFDQQIMVDYLEIVKRKSELRILEDYDGWKEIHAKQSGIERWARIKNVEIDFAQIFGNKNVPPYFSGKCYTVSYEFARFIADQGIPMAEEHTRYLPGLEDLMIGRLYKNYSSTA